MTRRRREDKDVLLVFGHWHVSTIVICLSGSGIHDWQVVGNLCQPLFDEMNISIGTCQVQRRHLQVLHICPPVLEHEDVAMFRIYGDMRKPHQRSSYKITCLVSDENHSMSLIRANGVRQVWSFVWLEVAINLEIGYEPRTESVVFIRSEGKLAIDWYWWSIIRYTWEILKY